MLESFILNRENMPTRREFLLSIPLLIVACTSSDKNKKMSDAEVKKLQEDASNYHKNIDKKLSSESHPIASTLRYAMDGTTPAVLAKKSTRNGVPAEEQLCHNCQFYKAIGDDYGSCQLLPQGNVTSNGWCFSWAKKQDLQIPTGNS